MNQKAWNEPRLLRGHARARLYSAFNGRCALCGEHLDHGWEADHVIRGCEKKRTRADEMQPLCPNCHAQKTKEESINMSKLFGFRGHQKDLNQWFEENIKNGKLLTDKVCLDVTPGGGKSTLWNRLHQALIRVVPKGAEGSLDHRSTSPQVCLSWLEGTQPLHEQSSNLLLIRHVFA